MVEGGAATSAKLTFRLAAPLAALGLAMGLVACTGMRHLATEPAPGVNLAGTWKLDPQHSTDSRAALQALLKAGRRGERAGAYGGPSGGPVRRQGGGPPGAGSSSDDALLAMGPVDTFPPDISLQKSLLAGGDWLKVEQRPEEIVIANAESSRSYVPGEHSVVGVPGGVADQRSGWKGREFWIILKPQVGPSATEKLRLSPDGKQLIETIEVGSDGRIPRLDVTRVYVPAHEVPSDVPSED